MGVLRKFSRFFLLFSIFTFAAFAAPPIDTNTRLIQQTITAFMQKHHIAGMDVELIINGQPTTYHFGYADIAKKQPVTDQTIFNVGAISKIMTSLLLAEQIDLDKMHLDDVITTYDSHLPRTFDDVTLQSLATHTAGFALNAPTIVKTPQQLNDYFLQLTSRYPTDEKWQPSNLGMGMLAKIVAQSTHRELNDLYRKEILAPLGMQPIGLIVPDELKMHMAQGYDQKGQPSKTQLNSLLPGATSMHFSATDMQHFLSAAVGVPGTPQKILYPMRLTQAAYVRLPSHLQGLAWQIHPLEGDTITSLLQTDVRPTHFAVREVFAKPAFYSNALIDKTSTANGFSTYIAVIPNKKAGIALMANRDIDQAEIVKMGRQLLFKLARSPS
jgi:beta-lactamase class C